MDLHSFLHWPESCGGRLYFGNSAPSVSQPVVVSAAQQAESARQAQQSELKRQGLQSTILSQQQGQASTNTVGGRTLLGG